MIGRETVVDALERMIATERFVTLVGPGGIGKTTVALALAHRMSRAFDGDVAVVDLAIQRGDSSVAGAVATALQLTRRGGDLVVDVASPLRSRRLLLILDSCEHVIAGAAARWRRSLFGRRSIEKKNADAESRRPWRLSSRLAVKRCY
jgi:predicted ATPase